MAKLNTRANRLSIKAGDIVTMPGYKGTYTVCELEPGMHGYGIYDFYAAPTDAPERGFPQPWASVDAVVHCPH